MAMLKIPDHGLICPLCGCSTVSVDGAIDVNAREIDDSAVITCTACHFKDNGNVFTETDPAAQTLDILSHYDITVPIKVPSYTELVRDYIDACVREVADSLEGEYCPKSDADLICDKLSTYLENLFAKSIVERREKEQTVTIKTPFGTLMATPSDHFDDVPDALNVTLDNAPVVTIRPAEHAIYVIGWNDNQPDADDAYTRPYYVYSKERGNE